MSFFWGIFHKNIANKMKYKNYSVRGVRFIVFNTTFNNSSVILWLSVLWVEETRVPRENHLPVASHWQTLLHNVASSYRFRFMVFNATFNNSSVILWQSVLLVEEIRVPRENHLPVASHWQTLSHNVAFSYRFRFMVFNASCNNISVISWLSFSYSTGQCCK